MNHAPNAVSPEDSPENPPGPSAGALTYLDEQIEAVRAHLPAALGAFDATAVHQSRVATRRLKAGFDVLEPLLADLNAGGIAKAGKGLRRRLGPLRDLDVMIDRLAAPGLPPRLSEAAEWVTRQFQARRTDARAAGGMGPKKYGRLLAKFDHWARVRQGLEPVADAITPLLSTALHERFAAFAGVADTVSGVVTPPADAPPVDVHELRIDGKAVRYAFEIAAAHGLPVPKKLFKTFKAMQESLGDWHDAVVLAEQILRAAVDTELPLHRPALASAVLDVARTYLQASERSLAKFNAQWKRSGESLARTLAERVPLTVDATPIAVAGPTADGAVAEEIIETSQEDQQEQPGDPTTTVEA